MFHGPLTRTAPNKPSSSYVPTVINATPIAMSASLAIACLHRRRQATGRWVAGTPRRLWQGFSVVILAGIIQAKDLPIAYK